MATIPLVSIVSGVLLSDAWTPIYDAPSGKRVSIDAACFNNTSSTKINYSIRINRGGTVGDESILISDKTIRPLSNDLAPAIIGQSLSSGWVLEGKADTAAVVSVHITGTMVE